MGDISLRDVLLTIHVICAVIWVGGGVALNVLATRILRADPEILRPMIKTFDWVVNRTIIPASLLVLIFGVILVIEGVWDFSDTFVILGIIGGVSTFILGITVLSPRLRLQEKLWDEHGDQSEIASKALARTLLIARIDVVMLLVIVGIMVTKPAV